METVIALLSVAAVVVRGGIFAKLILHQVERSARAERRRRCDDQLIIVTDPEGRPDLRNKP